jgi:CBS domain containing-hemolysin-like protein
MDIIFQLVLAFFLAALNGFFVAAEFAIVKVRSTQLESIARQGDERAKIGLKIVSRLDAYLSATQLGITLASLALGWVGHPVFEKLLDPVMDLLGVESERIRHTSSFIAGFSLFTYLHIVIGELAPKSLAIQYPLPTSLWIARPLDWFYRCSYIFIDALNHSALWILKRAGVASISESEMGHSEEELRMLIASSYRNNEKNSAVGRNILLKTFDLGRRGVKDVMAPRKEIVYFNLSDSLERWREQAIETKRSRFPLCGEGGIDDTLGIIHFKDLFEKTDFASPADKQAFKEKLATQVRPLIYIPETSRLEPLLKLFLAKKSHFALAVDEYGETAGVVTLENVLEELVGQIQDEFDQSEKPTMEKLGENRWRLSGLCPATTLAHLVHQPELLEEDYQTVNGLVLHRMGNIPQIGAFIELGKFKATVESLRNRRVESLLVEKMDSHPK